MKWVDLLIILIWGLSSISGYKRGFILTAFSLASYLIAFIVAKTYYPLVAEWIKKTPVIFEGIRGFVGKNIQPHLSEIIGTKKEGFIRLPDLLKGYLYKELPLETYAHQTIDVVKEYALDLVASFFINIISMIVLFILVRTIIILIGHLVNGIFELPLLSTVNSLGGGIIGFLRGFVFVTLAILIMTPLAMANLEGAMAKGMQESRLLPIISQYFLSFLLEWL